MNAQIKREFLFVLSNSSHFHSGFRFSDFTCASFVKINTSPTILPFENCQVPQKLEFYWKTVINYNFLIFIIGMLFGHFDLNQHSQQSSNQHSHWKIVGICTPTLLKKTTHDYGHGIGRYFRLKTNCLVIILIGNLCTSSDILIFFPSYKDWSNMKWGRTNRRTCNVIKLVIESEFSVHEQARECMSKSYFAQHAYLV